MQALVWLALCAPLAADTPPAVTLADVLARARPAPEVLAAEARIAELERALAETAGHLREGPTAALSAGPRRTGGSTETDVAFDLELPLLAGGGARERLAAVLARASAAWRAEAGALAEARLRAAYLAAWAAARRLELRREELSTAERLLAVARRRVEAGADPPFEVVLAEAERAAAGVAVAEAEAERARAWAELAALASGTEVAPAESPEASSFPALAEPPGNALGGAAPDLDPPSQRARFAAGALVAAAEARALVVGELARLGATRDDSRWTVTSGVAHEADERVARLGFAYRFARSGERGAISRTADTAAAAARREAEVEIALLAARLEAALSLRGGLARQPPTVDTETALSALELRLTEGKAQPSEVLLLRRQLLVARQAALERRLAAHQVEIELHLLTREVTP